MNSAQTSMWYVKMGLIEHGTFPMIFAFLRVLIFLGIVFYFNSLKKKIPRNDRGILTIIIGFIILSVASFSDFSARQIILDLVYLPFLNADLLYNLAQAGYILGTFAIVTGLIIWSRSILKLHSYMVKTVEMRHQLMDQNELLQETTRDLEVRTIDYLEQREAALESEQSKINFLRNTSHEFRTPLNAIIGLSELMANGVVETGKDTIEYSKMINESGKNLLTTINTILEISRINSNEYDPLLVPQELADLLNECVNQCLPKAHKKSIQINILPEDISHFRAVYDKKAMHHILTHILDNALSYSPEGTSVTIEIVQTDKENTQISVRDQGPGIDPEYLNTIFEIFGRAEDWKNRGEGGRGLGLALSSKMATVQNSKLIIESDGNNGTTCTITLPSADDQISPTAIAS